MHLRLLADDLTGALDTAARFVPLAGPVPVVWRDPGFRTDAVAIDAGTRELPERQACATVARLAPLLRDSDIAFKKIDSLLRGHVAAELAVCMKHFAYSVVAPAFPDQGRLTRGGRQLVREGAGWRDLGVDLRAALEAAGLPRSIVYDAETDADLDEIVRLGRALPGRVLWCGTAGLAGALAGHERIPAPRIAKPVLALIGSDQPASAAQIALLAHRHHRIAESDAGNNIRAAADALDDGSVAVTAVIPPGTPRANAARRIAESFVAMLAALDRRPATLFLSGGETLRNIVQALGATHLMVDGEIEPGVPTSILKGGVWDGQRVVSKSGAFGDPGLLARLL